MENEEIERLVTSMKRKETSMFEMEELEVSKKSNIKVLKSKRTFTIEALDWTTVIDIDGDRKVLKQVENKGMGHYRVQKYD
jgi:predicted ATPase with chaperone activity